MRSFNQTHFIKFKSIGMPLSVNGYCKEFAATESTFVLQILYQILYRHQNYACFVPSSVHESSEELTKFLLK